MFPCGTTAVFYNEVDIPYNIAIVVGFAENI